MATPSLLESYVCLRVERPLDYTTGWLVWTLADQSSGNVVRSAEAHDARVSRLHESVAKDARC
jgi:hypothetical protein